MKRLLSILLIAGVVAGAEIDTKLYEGDGKEAYYLELRKQIEAAEAAALRPKAVAEEEKQQLERLRSAAAQTVQIEHNGLKALSESVLLPENGYTALQTAASLRVKQEANRLKLREIQSKLAFLKQTIERITEEQKPRLLSYQLQFAYYKLQQKNIEAKTALQQNYEAEIIRALNKGIPTLQCDGIKTADAQLAAVDAEIEKAAQRKIPLQIDLEKAVIEENTKTEQLSRQIGEADTRYQKALAEKIMLLSEEALCMLHDKRHKAFFQNLGDIETAASAVGRESRPLYTEQDALLRELAKEIFGTTRLFFGATLREGEDMLTTLKEVIASPLFVFNERAVSFLSLLKALSLIILGFFAGVFYKRWIARMAAKWPDMSQMSIRLASNIGYYLIVIVAFMIALSSIGIDMTSISLIAGALSIGIGFGLQTVVSNLIAGIILMFERTIRIGDLIEISDAFRGRVTDMRIRSTTIRTFDGIDIVIPNSSFIQNSVINWTLEDATRRLHIPFGVAYGTEVDTVKTVILEALEESALNYIRHDPDRQPDVWMVAMNSSSVDYELLVWVEWNYKLRPNALRSDFLILIYKTLYKHGIPIPFPQLDLHLDRRPPAPQG